MCKSNKRCHIIKEIKDEIGRFIAIVVECDAKNYLISNVYAPNNDDPDFFAGIIEKN